MSNVVGGRTLAAQLELGQLERATRAMDDAVAAVRAARDRE